MTKLHVYYLPICKTSMKLQLKDCKETFFGRKGETLNLIILLDWIQCLRQQPREVCASGLLRKELVLGKWLWRFSREREAFWAKLVRSIHGLASNWWDIKSGTRAP